MAEFISELSSYVKTVFLDGIQIAFTVVDLIGVVVLLLPSFNHAMQNSLLARNVGVGILAASFIAANFSVYRRSVKSPSFDFEIIKVQPAAISGEAIIVAGGKIAFQATFDAYLQVLARVSKPGPATSIRLFIESIEPDCLIPNTPVADIEISCRQYQSDPHLSAPKPENPFYLKADEIQTLLIGAPIPLSLACIEEQLGCLAALRNMKVVFVAQLADRRLLHRAADFDFTQAHRSIEEQIAVKIAHAQNMALPGKEIMEIIKRYYGANRWESIR